MNINENLVAVIEKIGDAIHDDRCAIAAGQGDITAEAQARIAGDNALDAKITAEAEAREAADDALGGRIDTVVSDLAGEVTARTNADTNLQTQIDAITSASDVVDVVGTKAALNAYDTSKLTDRDIVKVLADESRDGAITYYRWLVATTSWEFVGSSGPMYTKAEADAKFAPLNVEYDLVALFEARLALPCEEEESGD